MLALKIIENWSPNCDERTDGVKIDTLVLHYTGMKTADEALARMCDADAEVSAHYMVDEDGEIYQLVEESKRAWHAGLSWWRGRKGPNDFSIGIEIVNPGHEHGYVPFPPLQMLAVTELCEQLVKKYNIAPINVIAHSDVAPSRKQDPGELFDWKMLAGRGVGLWPKKSYEYAVEHVAEIGGSSEAIRRLQKNLKRLGYEMTVDGYFGVETSFVVEAFQRHWCQARLDGVWDKNAQAVLEDLLKRVG
jgi:N-acetylmuramoyl-L-alanine amidase